MNQSTLRIATAGRGLTDITSEVAHAVTSGTVSAVICNVFVHHTSASLVIQENADPDVRRDLDAFFARLCPDGDPLFIHTDEGPDDMPAHVRSAITATSISIPVTNGRLDLGTWQGIYLWEHRHRAHHRRLTVTVVG